MTMANVTRKKAKHERTMMIAISQDNFRAADPASDHNLSREMHLEISPEIHLNNDLKLSALSL